MRINGPSLSLCVLLFGLFHHEGSSVTQMKVLWLVTVLWLYAGSKRTTFLIQTADSSSNELGVEYAGGNARDYGLDIRCQMR